MKTTVFACLAACLAALAAAAPLDIDLGDNEHLCISVSIDGKQVTGC